MSGLKIKAFILLILTFLIACIVGLRIFGGQVQKELVADVVGTPLIANLEQESVNSDITQIVASDKNLYLVYGHRSIVQVYSIDGSYQYTIAVYDHNNGRTEIAFEDGILYICDKISNVYMFSGKECIDFIDRSETKVLRGNLSLGTSSKNYSVRAGSIWYTANGADTYCIIKMSGWSAIYQNSMLDLVVFCLLIAVGAVLHFPYQSKQGSK